MPLRILAKLSQHATLLLGLALAIVGVGHPASLLRAGERLPTLLEATACLLLVWGGLDLVNWATGERFPGKLWPGSLSGREPAEIDLATAAAPTPALTDPVHLSDRFRARLSRVYEVGLFLAMGLLGVWVVTRLGARVAPAVTGDPILVGSRLLTGVGLACSLGALLLATWRWRDEFGPGEEERDRGLMRGAVLALAGVLVAGLVPALPVLLR